MSDFSPFSVDTRICLYTGNPGPCHHAECSGQNYVRFEEDVKKPGLVGATENKFKNAWQRDRNAAHAYFAPAPKAPSFR